MKDLHWDFLALIIYLSLLSTLSTCLEFSISLLAKVGMTTYAGEVEFEEALSWLEIAVTSLQQKFFRALSTQLTRAMRTDLFPY